MRNKPKHLLCLLACTAIPLVAATPSHELVEPLTLSSENGILDILMIAKAAPVNTLPANPIGWVYEICKRPLDGSNACPQKSTAPNYYGGTLLRLQRGDTLKVHLVNQLPLALDSEHSQEVGREFLVLNPTNIHTHGMLVSPHEPSAGDPTYGDNVFVLTFNSANGKPIESPHMHSTVRYDFTDYNIKIPANHPSGLFWFHPHAHGLALNQVSAGLAGIITVGEPDDYICKDRACYDFIPQVGIRHIILKDAQILPNNGLQDQEDPDFCDGDDQSPSGSCAGANDSDEGGSDYTNGHWFFTLNGQVYPTISVKPSGGEIWRITNTSGSATYDLSLWNAAQQKNMLMQVISVDGVSVSPTTGMTPQQSSEIGGAKFVSEACPNSDSHDNPICARRLHMMPSARVEVWVTYRDSKDNVASAPAGGSTAIFRTNGYQTGPSGDTWPAVDLAQVNFSGKMAKNEPSTLAVKGDAIALLTPNALATDLFKANQSVEHDASCKALPRGHMRRIFYGVPTTDPDAFGLAYEELDEHGKVVGPMATDVEAFDPMTPTVCLPLGPGNSPVTERWELINVATEDHNFHIHQTKFRVLTKDEIGGTILPNQILGKGVMLDNVPLAHADGVCGNNPPGDLSNPISDWRSGLCKVNPIVVEIPFAIAGDFVYHCHILEHEDGGMMARIRVRPHN